MTNDERLYESNCADARRNLRHYSDHPCLPPLMSPEDVKRDYHLLSSQIDGHDAAECSLNLGLLKSELAEAKARIAVLEEALRDTLRGLNNAEVIGEWEALEINPRSRKEERAKLDAIKTRARQALASSGEKS